MEHDVPSGCFQTDSISFFNTFRSGCPPRFEAGMDNFESIIWIKVPRIWVLLIYHSFTIFQVPFRFFYGKML